MSPVRLGSSSRDDRAGGDDSDVIEIDQATFTTSTGRMTASMPIKTEAAIAPAIHTTAVAARTGNASTSGQRTRGTNRDLPPGAQASFKTKFLPIFSDLLGSREKPWDTADQASEVTLAEEMQQIWDFVFPDNPAKILPRSPIYNLITQRGYEWRGAIGKAALTAIVKFWAKDTKHYGDAPGKVTYVKQALGFKKPFTWRDGKNFVGPFQGPLVLATLSKHFEETNGNADYGNPFGALALSATMVERALLAWSTGHLDSELADFSGSLWRQTTTRYSALINLLTEEEWSTIVSDTRALSISASEDTTKPEVADRVDDRCLLFTPRGE
ncbi:hypothetical protein BOTBODRAFT_172494 [Botryobasidium botryosum FD-172 SS1]|uniref:DUF6532 domain-containing protein n=1 Tax=Botryobasidium botryosum (strain FD-172 SS1) TaxID=930990 RepID=A0A067MZE5_BOTB1|nr:hypothetical protein BOTBODRAFT_172494 [Botryobasidium botryosum FD-172 SS1]